jgi:hypothetical protein
MPGKIQKKIASVTSGDISAYNSVIVQTARPLPTAQTGLSALEFFSGIG